MYKMPVEVVKGIIFPVADLFLQIRIEKGSSISTRSGLQLAPVLTPLTPLTPLRYR